jgi:hypothetical protein
MRVERHPYKFDIYGQFPNAREFRGWEGGCAFRAERDGRPFLIIDEGTMADFLDENDPTDGDTLNCLVSVIEFEDDAEREAYIAHKMGFGVDLERHSPMDDAGV